MFSINLLTILYLAAGIFGTLLYTNQSLRNQTIGKLPISNLSAAGVTAYALGIIFLTKAVGWLALVAVALVHLSKFSDHRQAVQNATKNAVNKAKDMINH
jgi:hypothetical protein